MNRLLTRASASSLAKPGPQSRTALVVDDQPAIGDAAANLVTEGGYQALTATSAKQAMQIARENGVINLLRTDVEMRGLWGGELAMWFRITRPNVAIVFMSGNAKHETGVKEHPFIGKPLPHLDDFLKIIEGALNQGQLIRSTAPSTTAARP